jgi:hypothetical protein
MLQQPRERMGDMTYRVEGLGLVSLSAGLLSVGLLMGCTSGPASQDPSWKMVPITDVGMVVGEWEGIVRKERATLPEGSVRLMIRPNNTYLFAGQSASKAAVGSGELEARDGRLVGDTETRAVRFTLYDHKGKAVVLIESTSHATGERYRGEFTKVRWAWGSLASGILLGVVSGSEEKGRAERAAAATVGVKRSINWLWLPETEYLAIRSQVF